MSPVLGLFARVPVRQTPSRQADKGSPVPESSMLSVYVPAEFSLKKIVDADLAELPESAVWLDLVKPSGGEDKAVERLAGIAVPTREDMQEIEISSRLYIENGARYMTATLMCAADTGTAHRR
jgi:Mg2+ and Co2+ transporter CorA